ncbi:MAG TPA: NrsF family protein [Steroidobacteraceae bacterium]|nr:NrsF family protein [Steroidobacteraceae bacterium]
MRTEALIRALVADNKRPVVPISRMLLMAVLSGMAFSAVLFGITLHVRTDIWKAIGTVRFDFKLVVTLTLAVTAAMGLPRSARPQDGNGSPWTLAAAPLLVAVAVAVDLLMGPHEWLRRLIGQNALHCLLLIPMLSLAPAIALLLALRSGAPLNPKAAGARAGLLASGLGATLYALTCPDDSPLFIATWYTMATGTVTALCAYIGRYALRW